MSLEKATMSLAGLLVILSVVLAWYVHPGFKWLTLLVGFNLFQSAFTGVCPIASLLHKTGIRSEKERAYANVGMKVA